MLNELSKLTKGSFSSGLQRAPVLSSIPETRGERRIGCLDARLYESQMAVYSTPKAEIRFPRTEACETSRAQAQPRNRQTLILGESVRHRVPPARTLARTR